MDDVKLQLLKACDQVLLEDLAMRRAEPFLSWTAAEWRAWYVGHFPHVIGVVRAAVTRAEGEVALAEAR